LRETGPFRYRSTQLTGSPGKEFSLKKSSDAREKVVETPLEYTRLGLCRPKATTSDGFFRLKKLVPGACQMEG